MALFLRENDALTTNPPLGVDEALSVNGSDWLWAVAAVYSFSFVNLALYSQHLSQTKVKTDIPC